jgi:protein phosphatase
MTVAGACEAAALSHVGTERERNEDHACSVTFGATRVLVAVADGVSSAPAGDTASRTAIKALVDAHAADEGRTAPAKRLAKAFQNANIAVYDLAVVVPELRGMSTTLTAACLWDGELHVAHAGDTRLYRVRDGKIAQLTKDHTVVAERTRLGLMSPERARAHPDKSILTRSLGRELIVSVDRATAAVRQGDTYLVCSDGLYNVLGDDDLVRILSSEASASEACERLIGTANGKGTHDNLSAAVMRATGSEPARARSSSNVAARLRRWFVR